MIDDKYRPWINPSYFDDWEKIMDSPYYGKEIEMAYRYTIKLESQPRIRLIWNATLDELMADITDSTTQSGDITKIQMWRTNTNEIESSITWKSGCLEYTIKPDFAFRDYSAKQAMDRLINELYFTDCISKRMYDSYWNYMYYWPKDKYQITIKAEDMEDNKLICFVDQITGKKFYTSEYIAKTLAKQIEDDMSIPWGDSEGYSKYFKTGGDMKINIHTGGIMPDNYTSLVRTYLGQINNPYKIGTVKMEATFKPSSGRYKCEKGLDCVIRKVQINEKKKVCTIVWTDGEVTMAKCGENDIWDPEKGLLVCIAKRFWVSGTQFNKWLKAQIPEAGPVEKAAEDIYKPKHAAE